MPRTMSIMEPLSAMPAGLGRVIRFVITDVDDTLTADGRLAARTLGALERLQQAGIRIIPATAAPAGWCDAMARMWPVDAVIAENGGLYFARDHGSREVRRRYHAEPVARGEAMRRLLALGERIAASVPGAAIAADQPYRETTLALTVAPADTARVLAMLRAEGANATANSLWVLGWFGGFDKLEAARLVLPDLFGLDLDAVREASFYVGDSLNDEPMFAYFPKSAGVATIADYAGAMTALPRWITTSGGGGGFVEVADALLAGA